MDFSTQTKYSLILLKISFWQIEHNSKISKQFQFSFIDLIIVLSEDVFVAKKRSLVDFFRSELRKISAELQGLHIPESQKSYIAIQKFNQLQIDLEQRAKSILESTIASRFFNSYN